MDLLPLLIRLEKIGVALVFRYNDNVVFQVKKFGTREAFEKAEKLATRLVRKHKEALMRHLQNEKQLGLEFVEEK